MRQKIITGNYYLLYKRFMDPKVNSTWSHSASWQAAFKNWEMSQVQSKYIDNVFRNWLNSMIWGLLYLQTCFSTMLMPYFCKETSISPLLLFSGVRKYISVNLEVLIKIISGCWWTSLSNYAEYISSIT